MLLRRKAVRLGWLLGSGGRPQNQSLQGALAAPPAEPAAPGYTAHYTASSQQHDEFKAEPYFQCKLSQTVGCKRVRLNVTGAPPACQPSLPGLPDLLRAAASWPPSRPPPAPGRLRRLIASPLAPLTACPPPRPPPGAVPAVPQQGGGL
jgi:hypothetical protein